MESALEPEDTAEEGRGPLLHLGLFLLTCATTFIAGGQLEGEFRMASGLAFSGTLMTILVFHEMGHYLVARRHGIDVSLPYFIPLPPFISLGTMGAVIRMRDPISDRNQLLDVGAAGPLAGLCAAIPLLLVGLSLSPVANVNVEGAVVEGNSILYVALKWLVHGQYLPAADGADVQLHPMAFAAWVGLLITMINLIPIGQLDGGHIAAAIFGDRHERMSGFLHRGLIVIGAGVFLFLVFEARAINWSWSDSAARAVFAAMPWWVWGLLLLVMRRMSQGVYHPPVDGEPLTASRRRLAWLVVIVFLLIFTPVPLRGALP